MTPLNSEERRSFNEGREIPSQRKKSPTRTPAESGLITPRMYSSLKCSHFSMLSPTTKHRLWVCISPTPTTLASPSPYHNKHGSPPSFASPSNPTPDRKHHCSASYPRSPPKSSSPPGFHPSQAPYADSVYPLCHSSDPS